MTVEGELGYSKGLQNSINFYFFNHNLYTIL